MKIRNGKIFERLGICLNVLLHYKKFIKIIGKEVKIIKNDGLEKYNKLIGEIGLVIDFEFVNFKNPIVIWFPKLEREYCFAFDELELFRGNG